MHRIISVCIVYSLYYRYAKDKRRLQARELQELLRTEQVSCPSLSLTLSLSLLLSLTVLSHNQDEEVTLEHCDTIIQRGHAEDFSSGLSLEEFSAYVATNDNLSLSISLSLSLFCELLLSFSLA